MCSFFQCRIKPGQGLFVSLEINCTLRGSFLTLSMAAPVQSDEQSTPFSLRCSVGKVLTPSLPKLNQKPARSGNTQINPLNHFVKESLLKTPPIIHLQPIQTDSNHICVYLSHARDQSLELLLDDPLPERLCRPPLPGRLFVILLFSVNPLSDRWDPAHPTPITPSNPSNATLSSPQSISRTESSLCRVHTTLAPES